MTDYGWQQMERLCKLVSTEMDPDKFQEYLTELNKLLEAKQAKINPKHNDAA